MALTKINRATTLIKDGWGAFNTLIDDLLSTSNGKGASQIGIEDTAGNLSATNVEDAIAEIYSDTSSTVTLAETFDENSSTTTGLTWGYKGGVYRLDSTVTTVSAGTISLTDDSTNYVEIDTSDGNVKSNTTSFTSGRIPLRTIVTSSGSQTSSNDKRAWFSQVAGATTTTSGIVELATDTETNTGTATNRAITPANLNSMLLDEDDMSSNDATKVPTQQSVKAYADSVKTYVDSQIAAIPDSFPSGGIAMWSGTIANIPSGWYLCDGTNGTPNLTDRFVVHADGSTYSPGDTGGSKTITSNNLPAHTHSSGSLANNSVGNHAHSITTNTTGGSGKMGYQYSDLLTYADQNTGFQGSHTHTISGSTGSIGSGTDYMPKYYALAFIMKG